MIAEVVINSNVKNLNRTFDYNIPFEMEDKISIGSRVLVKFGNIKNLEEGFVVNIKQSTDFQVKDIIAVQDKDFVDITRVELAKWMAETCFCNISDCIRLMLPPGTGSKDVSKRIKEKNLNFVHILIDSNQLDELIKNKKIKSEKQIRILKFLLENGDTHTTDLAILTDTSVAIIKTLCKNEYLQIIEKRVERDPLKHKNLFKTSNLKLTEEQQKAYDNIADSIDDYMNSEFLIYGVTGSRQNRNIYAINTKSSRDRKKQYNFSARNFINSTDCG